MSKDNNTAVVEVFGLSKSKPHKNTSLIGTFTKTDAGIWKLSSVDN
ncbi:hypothetical protein [Clostridium sp. SM-530-WT-3G]|nr:hypothetical protein [Clostridium sp. SM-530-WT-3G]NME82256.1 hypothetical protein [Clostridium sp. SM-530-WT-3G]